MSFELDRLFHLAVSGAGDTGFPGSFFICAAFFVVYVIDRFFNWLDRRLFPALTILTLLILLSMCALGEPTILRRACDEPGGGAVVGERPSRFSWAAAARLASG